MIKKTITMISICLEFVERLNSEGLFENHHWLAYLKSILKLAQLILQFCIELSKLHSIWKNLDA